MKCPGCKHGNLVQTYLPSQLKVYSCRSCAGQWIQSSDYQNWRHQYSANSNSATSERSTIVGDSTGPKRCPGCQHLMLRYRIDNGLSFSLDACGYCGSIWLDMGKWEALGTHQLQHQLHAIVSPSWQWQIRQRHRQAFIEAEYRDRFHAEADRIQDLQYWLATHPKRSTILAYLNHPAWTSCAEIPDSNGSPWVAME